MAERMLATAVYRRAYRQATVFCVVAVLFLGPMLCLGGFHRFTQQVENEGAASEPGWQQTFVYDTSAWGAWKASVPSVGAFLNLLRFNLLLILTGTYRSTALALFSEERILASSVGYVAVLRLVAAFP